MLLNKKYNKTFFENHILIYYQDIFRFLMVLTNNRSHAEDLTQNVMEKAWKFLYQLKDPEKSKSWIFQIARNEAKTFYKKSGNTVTYETELIPNEQEFTEPIESDILSILLKREESKLILKSLELLDQKYAQIIKLRFIAGLDIKDIAYILDINYNTTRTHLKRGLKRLKEVYLFLEKGKEDIDCG
ncbi:RNA polymerase sigma factor [Clostridium aminobutyricum]|uniref:RNA polymerase sigma factor n=1 Tax=Clostridium aminobutyricum TaxID=33953 RepID=A0A939IHZ4_CLOAM|nr:RNA polymerase sigma factor [Clostridium aminobutyricum]MBN7771974.1 RNA polymerase sigma factor [Clostridium aminobutyricum]